MSGLVVNGQRLQLDPTWFEPAVERGRDALELAVAEQAVKGSADFAVLARRVLEAALYERPIPKRGREVNRAERLAYERSIPRITLNPSRRWECPGCEALTVVEKARCWRCGKSRPEPATRGEKK